MSYRPRTHGAHAVQTRTHIRHVYEKLNIHSKQELIDAVLFGSGVM